MNVIDRKNKEGFTIIEVVLVLAIAALIFLMVFIALPALQRNQRDTARKTVVGKVASAITSFQSNNRGKLPANTAADAILVGKYVDANPAMTGWGAPAGNIDNQYTLQIRVIAGAVGTSTAAAATTDEDIIYYVPNADCGTNGNLPTKISSNRKAAIATAVENGNFTNYICQAV